MLYGANLFCMKYLKKDCQIKKHLPDIAASIFFFSLFRAAPMAHGGSQVGLCHSHSNVGSELHLWPTLQLTAMPDP